MDWEDLKTFLRLASLGTVRRAAANMKLHHSTVARRIERLEGALGSRLFDRQPNGLSLTKSGEDLMQATSGVMQTLDDAELRVSGADTTLAGQVSVSTVAPIANQVIAPRLPEFAARHPGLTIEIQTSFGFVDIARGAAEVLIRLDNNPPETLVGKRLFPYRETIYASRSYAKAYMTRLNQARWIGYGSDGPGRPSWIEDTAFAATEVWGAIGDLSAQAEAARAGLGFVSLPCLIGDATPGLVRALPDRLHTARDVWLLTHPDLRRTRRINVVMQFLEDVLRAAKPLFQGDVTSFGRDTLDVSGDGAIGLETLRGDTL